MHPVELILAKQWAGLLSVPVLLLDEGGDLVYYNESAEVLLGRSFDESGPMIRSEWSAAFQLEDAAGGDVDPGQTAIARALDDTVPDQQSTWIRGVDGVRRHVKITAFPIQGLRRTALGVMVLLSPGG